jgi:Uroporphyrinogen decarboxylase (URO-D)
MCVVSMVNLKGCGGADPQNGTPSHTKVFELIPGRASAFGSSSWQSVLAMQVQGNVDPVVLFASEAAIESAVRDAVEKAGRGGHILNLGHGVLVGTPEDSVKFMFDLSKSLRY